MESKPNGEMPLQSEQELKEPTLEQWAEVYAESSGDSKEKILQALQQLQLEMSEEDRRELTMPIYGKEGENVVSAWRIVDKVEAPTYDFMEPSKIKTNDETEKAFVAFTHFSQEVSQDSQDERAKQLLVGEGKSNGMQFMTPKQAMIARVAFYRLTGKHMDERYSTMFPDARFEEKVPRVSHNMAISGALIYDHSGEKWQPPYKIVTSGDVMIYYRHRQKQVFLKNYEAGHADSYSGFRLVVSKEL
jgi:hypothetical protein